MIVSFSHTSAALRAGAKSATRRDWKDVHASRFHVGDLVDAYDRSPRNHGHKIATIRVVSVTREPFSAMPDSDYDAEGLRWLYDHSSPRLGATAILMPTHLWGEPINRQHLSRRCFSYWQKKAGAMWVLRFVVVSIEPDASLP